VAGNRLPLRTRVFAAAFDHFGGESVVGLDLRGIGALLANFFEQRFGVVRHEGLGPEAGAGQQESEGER
jgi:hypothetical protein